MNSGISKLISNVHELSSKAKNKLHAKKLALILATGLTLSSCNYEKDFDTTNDKEDTFTELLTDYKDIQKKNGNSTFEIKDYSKEIALGDTVSKNIIAFIKKDPRSDRTFYIVDMPGYVDIVINKDLKNQNINTTFDVNIDYSDDKKKDDIDYSTFFGVMNKIGTGGPNDEHVMEKNDDGSFVTKPYVMLFDYSRINEGLNDLENETTFHNQYTIEEDLPAKEMFKGEDAAREKIIVFSPKQMNQDLAGGLMELAKVDNIPVQVIVIDEHGNLVDAEIPMNLKTTWQEKVPETTNQTIHSNGMPFRYRYRLANRTNSTYSTHPMEEHTYGGYKSSSFKTNGKITRTTPAHFQKSNPVRSSGKFSGGHSIRGS